MRKNVKCAIIILNYNDSENCRRLVREINETEMLAEVAIYLVDNSESCFEEKSLRQLASEYSFKYIKSNNVGYSAGNNIGLLAAINDGHESFFVSNPDVSISKQCNIFSHFCTKYHELNKSVLIVGPSVYNPFAKIFENPQSKPSYLKNIFGLQSDEKLFSLFGGFFFTNKYTLKKIGMLPTDVFMYNEETIIALKIKEINGSIIYDNSYTVLHLHSKKFKGLGNEFKRKKIQYKSVIYVMETYWNYSFVNRLFYTILFWMKAIFIMMYKTFNGK